MAEPQLHDAQLVRWPTRFGPDYRETVLLRGGQRAQLTMLGRKHAGRIVRGYAHLSKESRYMRFLSLRDELTPSQLVHLTDTDGVRHLALGAGVQIGGACHEAGVGRFVQLADRPDTVEAAVTVVDAFQRIGLGGLLIQRLFDAARERGYRSMSAEILSDNRAMLGLLAKIGRPIRLERDGTVTVARIRLQ